MKALPAPLQAINVADHLRRLALAINQTQKGGLQTTGSVTLTANQATTQVSNKNCSTDSVILFMPTTANAAAEVGAGGMYVGTVAGESFTITHANNAQTDRTFGYVIIG